MLTQGKPHFNNIDTARAKDAVTAHTPGVERLRRSVCVSQDSLKL
jgi:hypothetical protein